MQQKIVLSGGPGTGKTAIINALSEKNFYCFEEVSREVIRNARINGIDQLFLSEPLAFSNQLLNARVKQFKEANSQENEVVFMDRGIVDVIAYLHYKKEPYPLQFDDTSKKYRYDAVFITPPWKAIYTTDNERYESYEEACLIHKHILNTYENAGYSPIIIPEDSIENRCAFIVNHL